MHRTLKCVLLVAASLCGNAIAQRATCTASLNTATGRLSIEAATLSAGSTAKSQLGLSVSPSAALSFVQDSAVSTSSACYDFASLAGGILAIPDIGIGGDYYSASLRQVGSSTQYTLDIAAKNPRLVPDPGIRVNHASNPFATVDSNGIAYLGYEDRSGSGGTKFQSASDGVTFSNPTVLTYSNRSVDSRKTLMPDGRTWRLYQYDPNTKLMTSYSSTDGNSFSAESGTRYTPASGDNNSLGVYDSYVATDNSVILTYVGDLSGKNNLRMARSIDNGLSFSYFKGNVLGDDAAGGGGNTFIDNKTLLLADGRRRMVTMRANEIHSFISSDGMTYTREPGVRLRPADFAAVGVTIYSLNDPVMVRTKEGRYRVYVAASTSSTPNEAAGNDSWVIVSALWRD